MLKIIIFLVIIFSIAYFVFNLFISKREIGSAKLVIPITLTVLILIMLFFILPRFGINPIALFQSITAKIIPFLSMIRGIIS
tara:strand:- start:498 stop:743 length:246 start_codon:yes stop_codon:yes gene_type:complete